MSVERLFDARAGRPRRWRRELAGSAAVSVGRAVRRRRARRARTRPRPCGSRAAAGTCARPASSTSGSTVRKRRGQPRREAKPPSERNVLGSRSRRSARRARRRCRARGTTSAPNRFASAATSARRPSPETSSATTAPLVAGAGARPSTASASRPGSATRKQLRSVEPRAGRGAASRVSRTRRDRTRGERPEPLERGDGRRSADAVGREPASRWNCRSAVSVSGPRMPSSRPASKPSALSRRWSSATSSPRSIGAAQVEQPVAEREAALDERAPRLGSADAVDPQPAPRPGTRAPRPRSRRRTSPSSVTRDPGRVEPLLEVADRVAAVSASQQASVTRRRSRPLNR